MANQNAKAEARKIIDALPDDVTYEDIHYHLYVREKIERGLRAIDAGQHVSQEQAEQQLREWLK